MNKLEWVNDEVKKIRKTILTQEVQPVQASNFLNILSALLGTAREECLDREMVYNLKHKEIADQEKTVTQAKTVSKTTDEYKQVREAENLIETVLDMISSLKYTIKTAEREYKEGKF